MNQTTDKKSRYISSASNIEIIVRPGKGDTNSPIVKISYDLRNVYPVDRGSVSASGKCPIVSYSDATSHTTKKMIRNKYGSN